MKTTTQLRNGSDYVAVDVVDSTGFIMRTPIYLQKDKAQVLQWRDREDHLYYEALVVFDGKELWCGDKLGFKWNSPVEELLTEVKI